MNKITVLLADDHAIVREGFRMLLEADQDIAVVAGAKTGREAVEMAKQLEPDVVIMDIAMPLLNGFEASRQILKLLPDTKILILSAHHDESYADQLKSIGVSGYLLKQGTIKLLSEAIRTIKHGGTFFDSIPSRNLNHEKTNFDRKGKLKKRNVELSSREAEVLQLVAEGKANKEMAAELCISIKTVEKHRQNLMEKLDIHDTAGLTRYAISSGVIENRIALVL